MKNRSILLIVIGLLPILLLTALTQATADEPQKSLAETTAISLNDLQSDTLFFHGVVSPTMQGVTVVLIDGNGNAIDGVQTDEDGRFAFNNVRDGIYRLSTIDKNNQPIELGQDYFVDRERAKQTIVIKLPSAKNKKAETDNIVVGRAPQANDGILNVTVIAADTGLPIPSSVEPDRYTSDFGYSPTFYYDGVTPASFEQLDTEHQYRVYVQPDEGIYLNQNYNGFETSSNDKDQSPFTPVVFPNGETVLNLEVTVNRSAGITGTVVDALTNQPIENIYVDFDSKNWVPKVWTTDGSFAVNRNITAGTITVTAEADYSGLYVTESVTVETTYGVTTTDIIIPMQKSGAITGTVISSFDDKPIPNAVVYLMAEEDYYMVDSQSTDENGAYNFDRFVETGNYHIRVADTCITETECFVGEYYDNQSTKENATTVSALASQTVSNINFSLEKKGVLRGTVTGAEEEEYISSNIYIYNAESAGGGYVEYINLPSYESEFAIAVESGTYYLRVDPDSPYVSEFYNGKTFETADPITVSAGQEISNLDFNLVKGGILQLAEITDSFTNASLDYATMTLYEEINGVKSYRKRTYSNEFNGLSTGTYYVFLEKEGYAPAHYENAPDLENATPIFVQVEQTTEITAELAPLATITGKVTSALDGQPIGSVTVRAAHGIEPGYTDVDGIFYMQFDADKIPESGIRLDFQPHCVPWEACYLDKIYGHSNTSPQAEFIPIQNGQTISNVNVSLDKRATIFGTIKDSQSGENLPISVSVFEDLGQPPISIYELDCYFYECPDDYSFSLDPGTYYLAAQTPFHYQKFFDDTDASNATPITVLPNQDPIQIDFLLDRGNKGVILGTTYEVTSGQPISYVNVYLYDAQGLVNQQALDIDYTSSGNTFGFYNLSPGDYYLYFSTHGQYIDHYWSNALTANSATPITVHPGGGDISINVPFERGGIAKAYFVDSETGEILPNPKELLNKSEFYLYNELGNGHGFYGTVFGDDDSIIISGLPTGTYYPWVFYTDNYTAGYRHINSHDKKQNGPIYITEGITTTITTPMVKGGQIKGTVQTVDEEIFTEGYVKLYQVDTQCGGRYWLDQADIQPDGKYSFSKLDPSFTYEVVIDPWGDSYPEKLQGNINVASGQTEIVDFEVGTGGKILGTITSSATNEPLENAVVEIYKSIDIGNQQSFEKINHLITDENGSYQSASFNPGTYYAVFSKLNYTTEIFDNLPTKNNIYLTNSSPTPISISNNQDVIINPALDPAPIHSGEISGFVYDSKTGLGSSYVDVKVYTVVNDELSLISTDETDYDSPSRGFYSVKGLADGQYYVLFQPRTQATPYENSHLLKPMWYGNSQKQIGSTSITISNGAMVNGVDIGLEQGGQISGNLSQAAYQTFPQSVNISPDRFNRATVFDEDGNMLFDSIGRFGDHSFTGLWPGTYYIYLHNYEYTAEGYCNSNTYYGEWYGGASSFEEATPIVITGAEHIENINGELSLNNPPPSLPDQPPAASAHKLSGTFTADGEPLPGVIITANNGATAITDSSGEYSFYLEDGSHTLTPSKNGYTFNPADRAVTLNGADLSGQDFAATALPTGSLSGIVTEDDSSLQLEGVDVLAYEQNGSAWQFAQMATTDENGAYQLNDLVAANYKLLFRTPLQTHKSEYYDNASSFNQGVAVALASGGSATDIHASLEKRPEAAIIAAGIESYTDPDTGEVTLTGNRSENSSVTISRNVSCESGDPADVQLIIGSSAFDMSDSGNGAYSATLNIPGDVASDSEQNMSVQYVCNGFTETVSVGELVLYDPSGIITNAETGDPIVDASVTLYRVAGASPDTESTTNECRTVDTRPTAVTNLPFGAWSSVPAAEISAGHPVDAAFDTVNGQALFSPAVPTQVTGDDGKYGWDVAEGCWYIVVEAEGFNTLVSPMVGVPPAVLDLDIALSKSAPPPPPPPTSYDILLPLIGR